MKIMSKLLFERPTIFMLLLIIGASTACQENKKAVEYDPGAKVNNLEELSFRLKEQARIINTNLQQVVGEPSKPSTGTAPHTPGQKKDLKALLDDINDLLARIESGEVSNAEEAEIDRKSIDKRYKELELEEPSRGIGPEEMED